MTTARSWGVSEGGSVTLTAQALDPEGESLAFEWDLDGDGAFEIPGRRVDFDSGSLEGPITRKVAVRATDPAGSSAAAHSTVNVLDVPKVEVTKPTEGAKVSGLTTVAASAEAEAGVECVEFLVDGEAVGSDEEAPYELAWDTSTHMDGDALVVVRATDALGNVGSSSELRVSVDNGTLPAVPPVVAVPNTAPTISAPRPAAGSMTRDATPRISAVVRDAQGPLGKSNVLLYVDGKRVARFSYTPASGRLSYTPRMDLKPGRHSVRVVARDPRGLVVAKTWSFGVARRR